MIQIAAPEGWTPPSEIESTGAGAVESGNAENGGSQAIPAAATKTPEPAKLRKQRQVVVGGGRKGREKKQALPDVNTQPVLPNEQWTNQATAQRRKIALLICGAAALMIVALSVVGFLVSQAGRNRRVAEETSNDKVMNQARVGSDAPDSNGPDGKDNSRDTDKQAKTKGGAKSNLDDPKTGDPLTNSDGKPNESRAGSNLDPKGNSSDPDSGQPPVLIGGNTPSNPSDDGKAGDAELDETGPGPKIENRNSILDQLGPVSGLVNDIQDLRSDSLNLNHEAQIGIGDLYIAKPTRRPAKLDMLLQFQLGQVEFPKMTLSQFSKSIGQLSGIPVQLDIQAMRFHGVSSGEMIQYAGEGDSVESILRTAVEPFGLTIVRKDWGVLVTPQTSELPTKIPEAGAEEFPATETKEPAEFSEKFVERSYQIFEISEESEKRYDEFSSFIRSHFAPGSWLENGGEAEIVREGRDFKIRQTVELHYWIKRYFDRVNLCQARVAQNSPQDEQSELLTDWQSAQSLLNRTSELDMIVAEPITRVFEKVEKETGLRIVIDWERLIPQGWLLSTEIPWEARGKPVSHVLDRLCRSMRLGYLVIDGKTVQLTTREKIDATYSLEIYPCHSLRNRLSERQLRRQVRAAFGDQFDATKGMSAMYYEPAQCIVAILPQSLHRRLQRILEIMEKSRPSGE